MRPVEIAIIAFVLILTITGIVILDTSYKRQNERCFYSADSMVIQFETQRIRHLKDVGYCLYKEKIVIWTDTQPEFSGRIDDVEIFHIYQK